MSDTQAWPSSAAVEAAMGPFHQLMEAWRDEIPRYDRDDPRKAQATAFVLALQDVEHQIRQAFGQPVDVRPAGHRVGEQTDPNIRQMRANRGRGFR